MTESTAASRLQDMIRKVEGILAKANSTSNAHEAETFFAKAQQLMAKHGIDEMMINRAAGEVKAEEVTHSDMDVKRSGYFESMVRLATEVARANGVETLIKTPQSWGTAAGVRFIGMPSDITKTMMLYTALLAHCTRERRTLPYHIDTMDDSTKEGKNAKAKAIAHYRHSFSLGYAIRIGERLWDMKRATEREATEADATGSLLPALIDKGRAVAEYKAAQAGTPLRSRGKKRDVHGINSGRSAADRADLGGGRPLNEGRKAIG